MKACIVRGTVQRLLMLLFAAASPVSAWGQDLVTIPRLTGPVELDGASTEAAWDGVPALPMTTSAPTFGGLGVRQYTDEEPRAVVETAAMLGRKVAAHAYGTEGIKAAVRAGVASIGREHELGDCSHPDAGSALEQDLSTKRRPPRAARRGRFRIHPFHE